MCEFVAWDAVMMIPDIPDTVNDARQICYQKIDESFF
jgi:hypothetical protein